MLKNNLRDMYADKAKGGTIWKQVPRGYALHRDKGTKRHGQHTFNADELYVTKVFLDVNELESYLSEWVKPTFNRLIFPLGACWSGTTGVLMKPGTSCIGAISGVLKIKGSAGRIRRFLWRLQIATSTFLSLASLWRPCR